MSKKPDSSKKDQHRSPHMVRLSAEVYQAMKALAEENDRPMTREVQQALIAHLKAAGKWPPATST
jgi:hypothetical protein